ncbi:hypothetical protein [Eikenella corrodens]|uniref:Uncharacterized protein n=1 Tax=Eikenella corrodens TaxID=539 RepID=A0A3S9SL14_EIKCO|nr:hypothetical protein [Eikenella corrodens]AZR60128.1 hypothetical protein ELB75_08895 [Eikenella corrodens]
MYVIIDFQIALKATWEFPQPYWQRAGVLLNMVAASTASPTVSYQIGQYFKSHDAEGTPAHLLAHAILGATTAAVSSLG